MKAVLALVLFVAPAIAQQTVYSGRSAAYWSHLTWDAKFNFIQGFFEGYRRAEFDNGVSSPSKLDIYFPVGMTFGEFIKEVDQVYGELFNSNIPVTRVMALVTEKFNGASKTKMDEDIAYWRRVYSKK